jgi:hypothetical protein
MTPDGRLELRDVATGQKMPLPFPLPDGVISVAFSERVTRTPILSLRVDQQSGAGHRGN